MQGIKDLTEIERLNFLKSIQLGCKDNYEFENYLNEYKGNLTKEEALRRIEGLFLEDEFLLLCKVMGTCRLINSVDQSIAVRHSFKVPDFLASFHLENSLYDNSINNFKFNSFIEVKTSNSDTTKKLKPSFIKKYSDYAAEYNKSLLLAFRIYCNDNPMWIIQSEDQFLASNKKVSPLTMFNSIGHLIFNDFMILTLVDIHLEFSYTQLSSSSGLNIFTNLHGYLQSLKITISDKVLELNDSTKFLYTVLCSFPGNTLIEQSKVNGLTIIKTVIPSMSLSQLSTLILKANYSLLDTDGNAYSSAARFLAMIQSNKTHHFDRTIFQQAFTYFNYHFPTFKFLGIGDDNTANVEAIKAI